MNTNRFFRTLVTMIFSVVILGSAAFAQGGRGQQLGEKVAQKLNLTQEQRDKLKQIQQNHAQELADVKALRDKMKEYEKNNDKANAQATREQIRTKMTALQQEMQSERNAVLTPEQQAQISQMKENVQGRRQHRMGSGN